MRKRRENGLGNRGLFSIRSYIFFFLIIAFAVTCCFLLFLDDVQISEEMARSRAPETFINILFISLLITVMDGVRKYFTMARPIRKILAATRRIRSGDFSVRIEKKHVFRTSENELDVIIDDLNVMAAELSSVETLRTDFISNVSHELKTPLAVIRNYATMLQSPELSQEERLEYSRAIVDASHRLSSLITNILKLNKLENQQIYPNAASYNLSEQLCECLLFFENTWEQKKINIETQIEEDIIITADDELLTLVWNNLFSNAVKFTEEGGTVRVTLRQEDGYVIVSVADTGIGMSAETGRHIFEKFYQGDSSHGTQGNGLGLALVKRVVDLTDGEISVESKMGRGSTFTVRLRRGGDGKIPDYSS